MRSSCSSSSNTRSTPARFMPQLGRHLLDPAQPLDVGLRVQPRALGRALGLDQPARLVHPQRLRVHLGQLGGDRDHEDAAVVLDAGGDARARGRPSGASRRPSRRIRSRGLPFITFESSLDGLALLGATGPSARRSRSGSGCRPGRGRPSTGGPSPRRRWTRAVLGARRGTRSFLVPCSVGTSTSAPRERLGDRDRHLDLEVVALAAEHRRLRRRG